MQREPYKMDLDRQFKSDFMHQHMLKISFQLVKHWPLDWQLIIKKKCSYIGFVQSAGKCNSSWNENS